MGQTYNCVAPGEVTGNALQHAAYLHVALKDDTIVFPHVDSCTAIAFICTDGVMAGGHVPMDWGDGTEAYSDGSYKQNARRMVREMLTALQAMRHETGTNGAVNLLISFGDSSTFQDIRSELTTHGVTVTGDLQWESLLPTGGDLNLNGPKQEVFAYDYTTKLCVGNFNFSSIDGVKFKSSRNQSPLFFVARKMMDWFRKDVTGNTLAQTFDGEYLSKCPKEELANWFRWVTKELGPCKGFDASTGSMLEGTVTFSFGGNAKVVATLKLKRPDPSNLITGFVHKITGPPKF